MTPRADRQAYQRTWWRAAHRQAGAALAVSGAALAWLTACEPESVIGRANQATAGACGGCLKEEPQSVAGCAEADARTRTKYDDWVSSPNDLSAFAGTVWKGRVAAESGAVLTIGNDLTAQLYVGDGDPPIPTANAGFLCLDLDCVDQPFFHGGIYPIHGATFTVGENKHDRNLHLELNPLSPFDGWCRLQEPVASASGGSGDACSYGLAFSSSPSSLTNWQGSCVADGVEVDCKWLEVARDLDACRCTSTGCFAKTIWAPGDPWIFKGSFTADLQYDPVAQSLSGNIKTFQQAFTGEDSRDLNLWLVSGSAQ